MLQKHKVMTPYADINGRSGIHSYAIGDDFIKVQFTAGRAVYVYTYASAGDTTLEEMKALAVSGAGLNTFIQARAKKLYDRIEDSADIESQTATSSGEQKFPSLEVSRMGLLDDFKEVCSLVKEKGDIDVYEKLLGLRIAVGELVVEVQEKDRRITELEEALRLKKTLVFFGGAYYEKDNQEQPKGSPYCPACFDSKHIAIHMGTKPSSQYSSNFYCGVCKTEVYLYPHPNAIPGNKVPTKES